MAGVKKYYHSSPYLIKDKLLPRPSAVIGGESAVFATNKKYLSLIFAAKWTDLDLMFGNESGVWICVEMYPGAFEKVFKGKSGYVYAVSSDGFITDQRLGLQGVEFINKAPVNILKTEAVGDIWEALQKTPINFVRHGKLMELLVNYVKRRK